MKMKHALAILLMPLAFTACSNDSELSTTVDNSEPVELRLSSGMQLSTRAAYTNTQNTQILSGEKVYAWVDETTTPTATEYIHAWELTADGSGNFNATRQNYPISGRNVNVYALHGNFTGITAGTTTFPASLTHTVATNQSTDFGKSDLLYASATGLVRQSAAHQLTFSHLLSKVEVYLVAGTGTTDAELATAQVTLQNILPSAPLTLTKSGGCSVGSASGTAITVQCKMQSQTDQQVTIESVAQNAYGFAEAVIVPQWVNTTHASGGDAIDFITVTIGTTSYTAQINKQFTAGNRYTYHVVVNKSGITLSSTITQWGDGGTTDITAQ